METAFDRASDRRTFTRVRFEHGVKWRTQSGEHGKATVRDVGRGGLCLSLNRGFWPDSPLRITFEDVPHRQAPVELEARTAWCRTVADGFLTGLRVVHDEPEALAAVSEVFYAALQRLGHSYGVKRGA